MSVGDPNNFSWVWTGNAIPSVSVGFMPVPANPIPPLWKEVNPVTPNPTLIQQAADVLRSLAGELPYLRRLAAVEVTRSCDAPSRLEDEMEYLERKHEESKEEAAYLVRLADSLEGKDDFVQVEYRPPVDLDTPTLPMLSGVIEVGDQDLVNDPEWVKNVLGTSPSMHQVFGQDIYADDGDGRDTDLDDFCPQGHHNLEGDCRHWFCSCRCERCRKQCNEGGCG